MTDRFNFYDIYGYVVPGFVAVFLGCVLLYGCFGWTPSFEVGETVVALLVAYVLGAGVHEAARPAVPSATKDKRYPSDFLIDKLSSAERQAWYDAIKEKFGIDLAAGTNSADESAKMRNGAFLLARTYLVQAGTASYAEQFQGLQAMYRGMAAVLWFFAWAAAGAACWSLNPRSVVIVGVIGLAISVSTTVRKWVMSWLDCGVKRFGHLFGWMLIGLGTGVAELSGAQSASPPYVVTLVCQAVACVLLAPAAKHSHDRYAENFAQEVMRGFLSTTTKEKATPLTA